MFDKYQIVTLCIGVTCLAVMEGCYGNVSLDEDPNAVGVNTQALTALWNDDLESGGGNWSSSGCAVSSSERYDGSYSLECDRGYAATTGSIDVSGYGNINVSVRVGTSDFESSDCWEVEYSCDGGGSFTAFGSGCNDSNGWELHSAALPSSCDGISNLQLRFDANASSSYDDVYADAWLVEGDPMSSGCTSDADCDDGLFCNGAETCSSGSCQAGTPVVCDDGDSCTDDACNDSTDSCDYVDNGSCGGGGCSGPYTDTNSNHASAGRANSSSSSCGWSCTETTYTAVGSGENLGTSRSTTVTLYEDTSGTSCGGSLPCFTQTDCTGGTDPYCGDGTCDSGEDCSSCSADCGACSYCGDGTCDAGEDCSSCSADCGACGYPEPTRHYLIGDSVMTGYRSIFQLSGTSYGDLMHSHLTNTLGISASKTDIAENGAGWTVCNAGSCNHCDQQVQRVSSSGHALLNISCVGNDLLDFESASASTMQNGMFGGGGSGTSLVDDILAGVTTALQHCNSTSAFPNGCTLIQAPTYDINDMCESASNVNWTSDAVAVCTNSAYGGCPFSTTPVAGQPRCDSGRSCRAMMLMDLNHMIGHIVENHQFTNPSSRALFLSDHVDTFAGHARDYASCDVSCSGWRADFDFNGDGEVASCNTGSSWISSSDSYEIHPNSSGHSALAADGNELLDTLYGN